MSTKTVTPEMIKKAGVMLKQEHDARLHFEKLAGSYELEKRAQKIAFREIELGMSEPFKSHEEFLSKVAGLMEEDLAVVEKALERGYVRAQHGGELIGNSNSAKANALEHYVTTGELQLD